MTWLLYLALAGYLAGPFWRPLFIAGALAQLGYAAQRGLALGRLPLLGPHDTLVFFSASIAVMAVIAMLTPTLRRECWFVASSSAAVILFTLFALRFKPLNMPLPQILDTLWFELHVVLAFFAYALFVVGGILCVAWLIKGGRGVFDIQYKAALVGWSFFSASMVAGGIWGYYAWGTYWLWTAKELWTSILWLYYALLLHLRYRSVSSERLAAWMGIVGTFVMLFTYLGVSMLMKSSHSF